MLTVKRLCQHCGREFMAPKKGNTLYCSDPCREAERIIKYKAKKERDRERYRREHQHTVVRVCKYCGNTFTTNRKDQFYCDASCRYDHSKNVELSEEDVLTRAEEKAYIDEVTRGFDYNYRRAIEKSSRLTSEYGFDYGAVQKAKILAEMRNQ